MARALRERGSDGRAKPVVQINKEYLKAGLDAPGPEDPAPGARVRSGRAGKQEYWQAHKKWFLTTFNAKDSVLKKRWLDKLWEQLPQASKDEYEKAAKGGKNKRVHRGWPPPHTNDGIIPLPGATKLPDVVRDNEVPIIDVGSGRATREEPFFPKIHAHEKRMAELPTGVDGRWVRKKHLGEGGFGTVSAWQKVTNDDGHHVDTMAVKDIDYDDKWFNTTAWAKDVLLPDGLKAKLPTEVYMHRIMQAAKSSPYIVNYRGYRVNDNLRTVRITQDLASGGSLRDLVRKNETKFLPPHYLHYVFLALVLACRKLEERAVVHRDLKMQNVVLDHSNFDDQMEGEDAKTLNAGGWGFRAQVCDFGLAMEEECEALINPTDYRGCTPGCQAPEQEWAYPPWKFHTSDGKLSSATNVFGIGVIMWQILQDYQNLDPNVQHKILPRFVIKAYHWPDPEEGEERDDTRFFDMRNMWEPLEKFGALEKSRHPKYPKNIPSKRFVRMIQYCMRYEPKDRPSLEDLERWIKKELTKFRGSGKGEYPPDRVPDRDPSLSTDEGESNSGYGSSEGTNYSDITDIDYSNATAASMDRVDYNDHNPPASERNGQRLPWDGPTDENLKKYFGHLFPSAPEPAQTAAGSGAGAGGAAAGGAGAGGAAAGGEGNGQRIREESRRRITIIMECNGLEDAEMDVRPRNTIANLATAARRHYGFTAEQDISVHFEGRVLDPQSTVADAGIEEWDIIEVQIR